MTTTTKATTSKLRLVARISAIQAECPPIPKTATNPFFSSKYADYSTMMSILNPLLYKHGVVVRHSVFNGRVVTTVYSIDDETDYLHSEIAIPEKLLNDPQKLGSCITYFRRYNVSALFDLLTEDDDDGNAASSERPPAKQSKPAQEGLTLKTGGALF